MNLFETGTLLRCPGGQVETVPQQVAAGVKWAALNMGTDPCVQRDPSVWDYQRKLYRDAGVPHGPWMHCHSIADIEFLITIGKLWNSDFIGVNVEDVVKDGLSLQEVGGYLLDFWVNPYEKPVHMPTLPWVQNAQGWQHVDFCTLALEMFPLEGQGQQYLDQWEICVDHAFAEGAKKVTLLFSTTSPRTVYPNVAHCLYTADNVLSADWPTWKDSVPQPVPQPPEVPPVALTPTQKKNVRAAITVYCERAEQYRMNRGYSQRRPVIGYGLPARADQLDDCSGFVSKVFYRVAQLLKIPLKDVLNYGYSGYGNTESMQVFLTHEAPLDKYRVGDVALWGRNDWDTTHTAICRKGGTRSTAIFTSHGHQSWRFADDAPEPITLANYDQYLIGVYRHPALL